MSVLPWQLDMSLTLLGVGGGGYDGKLLRVGLMVAALDGQTHITGVYRISSLDGCCCYGIYTYIYLRLGLHIAWRVFAWRHF